MKSLYVTDLKNGNELINEPFLMHDVVRRTTKDGRSFLLCTLADRTGQANGVFWDVPEHIEGWVRQGLVVFVTGRVGNYKEALQISITDLNVYENPDMSHFLAASRRSREEMVAELRQEIAALAQPWQGLASHILLDRKFLTRFANAPAARMMHHAYVGGLLEHTLSMAAIANNLADHYPYVNRDLLLAGVLLHDLGKAIEYTTESSFSFSDDGRLVGHIVRAVIMVEQAAVALGDFPGEDLRQLVHMITSHHGSFEWGSPVVPKTLEAILLHQIDLIDSRVQGFFDHLRNDKGAELWSLKPSYMFNTELRRPAGFAEDESQDQ